MQQRVGIHHDLERKGKHQRVGMHQDCHDLARNSMYQRLTSQSDDSDKSHLALSGFFQHVFAS